MDDLLKIAIALKHLIRLLDYKFDSQVLPQDRIVLDRIIKKLRKQSESD